MVQISTTQRILDVFYREPLKGHYLKGISRQTGIAHTSCKKILDSLYEEGIITQSIERRGSRDFPIYWAKDSEIFRKGKASENLNALFSSGLIQALNDATLPRAIVLFGSYSKGEDTESSDIDLYVQSKEIQIDVRRYEKVLYRKIHLIFKRSFKELPDELKNNIINGIVMSGYLEAF